MGDQDQKRELWAEYSARRERGVATFRLRSARRASGKRLARRLAQYSDRLAVVYVSSSRLPHTPDEQAQIAYQHGQIGHAHAWGWAAERIVTLDEDIGHCGLPAEERPGFRRLCDLISRWRVGIVLIADLARLTRSPLGLIRFLLLCHQHCTLCVVDGVIEDRLDPANSRAEDLLELFREIERPRGRR